MEEKILGARKHFLSPGPEFLSTAQLG